MKNTIKSILQKVFGFKNYLTVFSLYCIRRALKGVYEREFAFFVKMIPDKGIILDIGANIGITAVPLAIRKKGAVVHAYEPIAENFAALSRVTSIYKLENIRLLNLALGQSTGVLKMIMPLQGNAKQQGLSKMYEAGSTEKGKIYDVQVVRLDDRYTDKDQISAIKIDVENFEYEVLKGAGALLNRCKPMVYCELWNNDKRRLVLELMQQQHGYRIYVFDEEKELLNEVQASYAGEVNNFFLIHS